MAIKQPMLTKQSHLSNCCFLNGHQFLSLSHENCKWQNKNVLCHWQSDRWLEVVCCCLPTEVALLCVVQSSVAVCGCQLLPCVVHNIRLWHMSHHSISISAQTYRTRPAPLTTLVLTSHAQVVHSAHIELWTMKNHDLSTIRHRIRGLIDERWQHVRPCRLSTRFGFHERLVTYQHYRLVRVVAHYQSHRKILPSLKPAALIKWNWNKTGTNIFSDSRLFEGNWNNTLKQSAKVL